MPRLDLFVGEVGLMELRTESGSPDVRSGRRPARGWGVSSSSSSPICIARTELG